jgi:hypothetical protein
MSAAGVAPGYDAFSWLRCEPARAERDRREVADAFTQLSWVESGAGGFDGVLPLWPFHRAQPGGLQRLTGGRGLKLTLRYTQAYPMVAPRIRPEDPFPSLEKWTAHNWHVNGDGSLCLLESDSLWDPATSVVDLLLKAAGWRIEYALMEAQLIDAMSDNGIVSDDRFDHLLADTAPRTDTGTSDADVDGAADGDGERSRD